MKVIASRYHAPSLVENLRGGEGGSSLEDVSGVVSKPKLVANVTSNSGSGQSSDHC